MHPERRMLLVWGVTDVANLHVLDVIAGWLGRANAAALHRRGVAAGHVFVESFGLRGRRRGFTLVRPVWWRGRRRRACLRSLGG